eukprot:CAMPEP_0201094392 /NCGR_PEP_ID=MMETSP0812-20130820/2700_1 /ASSEMBLY_ACC=CAM_ASM_000668 /TAXON_ID=98059 /ORGANISM="Dinobryon sp., Strain UTEXLB2267" /LENGTH=244 /DNA_ID=CAMNT_0047346935 /DNA_START=220 /DNA_END=955 /DNA_ORIENTATION=+
MNSSNSSLFVDELLALAVSSVVSDVSLQIHCLETLLEDVHQAISSHDDDEHVQREQRVGPQIRGKAVSIARGRADDQLLAGSIAQVNDAVPEPGRVDEHISGMQGGGVSLQLAQPRRRLVVLLAHHRVGMRRKPVHVDAGLQVRGLAGRDEPPLLRPHHLSEYIDAHGAVDVGAHLRQPQEQLRGGALGRLDASNQVVVDHVMQLRVSVHNPRGPRHIEGPALLQLLEERPDRAVLHNSKQCPA